MTRCGLVKQIIPRLARQLIEREIGTCDICTILPHLLSNGLQQCEHSLALSDQHRSCQLAIYYTDCTMHVAYRVKVRTRYPGRQLDRDLRESRPTGFLILVVCTRQTTQACPLSSSTGCAASCDPWRAFPPVSGVLASMPRDRAGYHRHRTGPSWPWPRLPSDPTVGAQLAPYPAPPESQRVGTSC